MLINFIRSVKWKSYKIKLNSVLYAVNNTYLSIKCGNSRSSHREKLWITFSTKMIRWPHITHSINQNKKSALIWFNWIKKESRVCKNWIKQDLVRSVHIKRYCLLWVCFITAFLIYTKHILKNKLIFRIFSYSFRYSWCIKLLSVQFTRKSRVCWLTWSSTT